MRASGQATNLMRDSEFLLKAASHLSPFFLCAGWFTPNIGKRTAPKIAFTKSDEEPLFGTFLFELSGTLSFLVCPR
jgi:hypothetical protein